MRTENQKTPERMLRRFFQFVCPMDHRIPQKAGTARNLFVVIGSKALIHHIKFRDATVPGRVVPGPHKSEPSAMELGDCFSILPFRRGARLHSGFQPYLNLLSQLVPFPVLRLRQIHHRGIGLIHLGISIPGADLRAVSFFILFYGLFFKCFKLLLVAHLLIPFFCSDGIFHRPDQFLQPLMLCLQSRQVASQSSQPVKGGIVQTLFDFGQLHPEDPII